MRSEVWRPAARLVTAPREVRGPARQALRLGCEELAARAAEEMLQTEARPPAGKSPRWSAERRASYVTGRKAPRKRLACRVMTCPNGCCCIRAPVGAPPTPRCGCRFQGPGAMRRGNAVCCLHGLFEIVRRKCGRLGRCDGRPHHLYFESSPTRACAEERFQFGGSVMPAALITTAQRSMSDLSMRAR